MNTHKLRLNVVVLILLTASGAAAQTLAADDCSWEYAGSSRAEVKNRVPPKRGYRSHNRGYHITVRQWYDLVCSFSPDVPDKSEISEVEPLTGMEKVKVTLKGYVLAAKFERGEDHDIHAEIGGSIEWEGPHVVVEIPPLIEYCQVRKVLWDLVREDRRKKGLTRETSEWVFEDPPQVLVTGYIFLDAHHMSNDMPREEICRASGGRGKEEGGLESQVQGLWELHPVIGITPLRAQRRAGRTRRNR